MEKNEKELEKVDKKLEEIDSAYGKIKFNKIFFGVCAGVGVVCTGVGIVGSIAWGISVASALATGFGVASTAVGGVFYGKENARQIELNGEEESLQLEKEKVLAKK